jgi:hypothetical protein
MGTLVDGEKCEATPRPACLNWTDFDKWEVSKQGAG